MSENCGEERLSAHAHVRGKWWLREGGRKETVVGEIGQGEEGVLAHVIVR
jgi:hypothetical protein